MKYAVMQIGCLCCNEDTRLIAVTDEPGFRELGARTYDEIGEHNWQYNIGLVAYPLPEGT